MHRLQPLGVLLQKFVEQLVVVQTSEVLYLDKGRVVDLTTIQIVQFLQIAEVLVADADKLIENLVLGRLPNCSVSRITVVIFAVGDENAESGIGAAIVVNAHRFLNDRSITGASTGAFSLVEDLGLNVVIVVGQGHWSELKAVVIENIHFQFAVVVELQSQRKETCQNFLNSAVTIQVGHRTRTVNHHENAGTVLREVDAFLLLQPDNVTFQAVLGLLEGHFASRSCGCGSRRSIRRRAATLLV